MDLSQWPTPTGLVRTSNPGEGRADYFLLHPDGRVVAAFFFGCVFAQGLGYLISCSFVRDILKRCRSFIRICFQPLRSKTVHVDPENPLSVSLDEKGRMQAGNDEDAQETLSVRLRNDHTSLIFTLNLCFVFAAFAQFLSLLTFSRGWETGCAFLVAWAGMSSQIARLLGLLIIIIELASLLDLRRWTLWAMWATLLISLAFVFASNAIGTGTTKAPSGTETAFCYKQHNLPTSLVSSILHLLMEIYLAARITRLILSSRCRFDDIQSSCPLSRVISLFVLDILTVVPDAKPTNLFAQSVPFSIGAAIVVFTFNWKAIPRRRDAVQSLIIFNKAPQTSDPLLVPTPFTLHFPREFRDDHSWCSNSDHPAPITEESFTGAVENGSQAGNSVDLASVRSVENAVLSTATAAWRRSVKKLSLPLDGTVAPLPPPILKSAPPQLRSFLLQPAPGPRKILESQIEVAAQLEEENRERERQLEIERGQSGPAVPPMHGRPQATTVVFDDDISIYSQDGQNGHVYTPGSAVFGSDILRLTPRNQHTSRDIEASPAPTQTSFMLSPRGSRRTTYRHSYASSNRSRFTTHSSEESTLDDSRSGTTSRASKRQGFLSPTDSLVKSPWRSFSRHSSASARSRSREELPTVRETSPAPSAIYNPPDSAVTKATNTSRRRTFGQQSLRHSQKRPSRLSILSVFTPHEPVPPLPAAALLPTPQPVSPFAPMLPAASLPSVQVCPATPEPAHILAPPPSASTSANAEMRSPTWLTRPVRTSVVRGPRPPPSASIIAQTSSGWPALDGLRFNPAFDGQSFASDALGSRSRSNSCPSLSSASEPRSEDERRRPSV